jgi:excisionase family DNA binding protein
MAHVNAPSAKTADPLGKVWYSSREAARYLGVSTRTVLRAYHANLLAGTRTPTPGGRGGNLRFSRDDLIRFQAGQSPASLAGAR